MDAHSIISITSKHSLRLIEDCAPAHDATYKGRKVDTFGDYPSKNLGVLGNASAVVTDNEDIVVKICALSNYGSDYKYHHIYKGNNSRSDKLQAAFLSVKLPHLERMNAAHRQIANRYLAKIKNPAVILPVVSEGYVPVWPIFGIRCSRRDELEKHLAGQGIMTNKHYPIPMHLQECFRDLGFSEGDFPIAEEISHTELSLPMFYGMMEEEIQAVIRAVNDFA